MAATLPRGRGEWRVPYVQRRGVSAERFDDGGVINRSVLVEQGAADPEDDAALHPCLPGDVAEDFSPGKAGGSRRRREPRHLARKSPSNEVDPIRRRCHVAFKPALNQRRLALPGDQRRMLLAEKPWRRGQCARCVWLIPCVGRLAAKRHLTRCLVGQILGQVPGIPPDPQSCTETVDQRRTRGAEGGSRERTAGCSRQISPHEPRPRRRRRRSGEGGRS
jgi:hypothetical protein